MTLEYIRTYLLSDSGIAALLGTRVYPTILPQAPTFPAMTYQQITSQTLHTLDGPVALDRVLIQFDIYALTRLEVSAVGAALRAFFNGASGSTGSPGVQISGAFLEMERDFYESEPLLYRRVCDYSVWIR